MRMIRSMTNTNAAETTATETTDPRIAAAQALFDVLRTAVEDVRGQSAPWLAGATAAQWLDMEIAPLVDALDARAFVDGMNAAIQGTARIVRSAPQLVAGDMVAGAAAEGHGVIVGWRGLGDMTRVAMRDLLAGAGLPAEWLPPARSAHAQAGRIVQSLGNAGFVTRAERAEERAAEATYDARWTIGRVNHTGNVGDPLGNIGIVVTLTGDDLAVDGPADLVESIRTDYTERLGSEVYSSGDVTEWLGDILRGPLGAVRYGIGWYVPRQTAATAASLCAAFAGAWGRDWINPALPVATSEQLRAGIAHGLVEEVRAVCRRLATERAAKETGEIGKRRAGTYLGELQAIGERIKSYAALIGPDHVIVARDALAESVGVVDAIANGGIAARFDLT